MDKAAALSAGIPTIVFNQQNGLNSPEDAMLKTTSLAAIDEDGISNPTTPDFLKRLSRLVKQRIDAMKVQNQISPFFVPPRLVRTDFFAGDAWHQYEEKDLYASHKAILRLPNQPITSYNNIFTPVNGKSPRFVSLIGHPACGCTTLTLKFVSERLSKNSGVILIYDFVKLLARNGEKLTLKEMLLNKQYPGLGGRESASSFNWILRNQHKCTVVIDRLNANRMQVVDDIENIGYSTKTTAVTLIKAILSRKLLPQVSILTACRPNNLIMLDKEARPDATYLLYGFSTENVNILWTNLVGRNSKQLWREMLHKAPLVLTIMPGSPLLMQRAAKAIDRGCNTTAQIYNFMYNEYVSSIHCSLKPVMVDRLRLMAFEGHRTMLSDIMSIDDVKDFMVALPCRKERGSPDRNGGTRLFFIHLIVQEYLASEHLCLKFDSEQFRSYLKNKIHDRPTLELLLASVLFDTNLNLEFAVEEEKRQIFANHVTEVCRMSTAPVYSSGPIPNQLLQTQQTRYLNILEGVRESNDGALIRTTAQEMPDHIDFSNRKLGDSEIHSFCRVLSRCEKIIERIILKGCGLSSQALIYLTEAIIKMPGTVICLDLSGNKMQTRDLSNLTRCFGKIERILYIKSCLRDSSNKSRPLTVNEWEILRKGLVDTESEARIIATPDN